MLSWSYAVLRINIEHFMCPGKWFQLKRERQFHQSKYSLDVDEVVVQPCLFINAQT